MADIVKFPEKKAQDEQTKLVWRCSCGCTSFELNADHSATCLHCRKQARAGTGDWRKDIPDPPALGEEVKETEAGDYNIISLQTPEAAIRHLLTRADASELFAIITIKNDGHVRTWSVDDLATDEQEAWFRRRMEVAVKMLKLVEERKTDEGK